VIAGLDELLHALVDIPVDVQLNDPAVALEGDADDIALMIDDLAERLIGLSQGFGDIARGGRRVDRRRELEIGVDPYPPCRSDRRRRANSVLVPER
jgi:hypothetical protein